MPNTNTAILTDPEIKVIERAFACATYGNVTIKEYELAALCQTARALREVNQGIIDGIQDGKKLLHDQIQTLQSKLAQMEQEREEQFAQIDSFRASGCNVTFWCTPRAVVTQITFHDNDASPDIDKSFVTLAEALEFATTIATKAAANGEAKGGNDG